MIFTKRKSLYFLLFFALIIGLAACGSSSDSSSGANGGNNAEGDTFKLTMNVAYPPPTTEIDPKQIGVEKFAEKVNEKTDGRVDIEIFYSNQLVAPEQSLDALQSGTIDIQVAGPIYGDRITAHDVLWMPFIFEGAEHAYEIMTETEVGEIYERQLEEHGVKNLMTWPTAATGIISKDPIESLADMDGKTFRLSSGIWTDWFKEVGVAPANVAGAEQYEALMRGALDGTIYPFYALETNKLYEVTKHMTLPGAVDPVMINNFISLKTWEKLPEDIQNTILEVAKELEPEAIEVSKQMDEHAIKFAEENGITVHELSEEEVEKFKESTDIIWEQFGEKDEDTKRIVEILKGE